MAMRSGTPTKPFDKARELPFDDFRRIQAERRVKAMMAHARHAGNALAKIYARTYGDDAIAFVDTIAHTDLRKYGVQPELMSYAAKVAKERIRAVAQ